MFKKSSVSYKVLPEHKKVIRPVVPSIKLVLKNRSTMKVTPDISNSTTYNYMITITIKWQEDGSVMILD